MKIINKAAAIIISNRKLLVVREKNDQIFVSPGGTKHQNEDILKTLSRELFEELSITIDPSKAIPYGVYSTMLNLNPPKKLCMQVFFIHQWQGDIKPSGEISDIAWITSSNLNNLSLGSIFAHSVIPSLVSDGLID